MTVKYLFHYFTTDFDRAVAVVIGDVAAAADEIRKTWATECDDYRSRIVDGFRELSDSMDREHLNLARSARETFIPDCGMSIVYFPVLPEDSTVVHEMVHVVQNLMRDTGISDEEFEAYMVEYLYRFFSGKIRSDMENGFVLEEAK